MVNRFFSQYLLNNGILTAENVGRILAKSLDAVPGKDILQMDESMYEEEARLGQVLLDEKLIDAAGLERSLQDIRTHDYRPVDRVVVEMLEDRKKDPAEYAHLRHYVELFLSSIQSFLHTDAAIVRNRENDRQDTGYLIYQTMGGSLRLTVGCCMTAEVLLAMASRFSDEPQDKVDEMAIDCIEEFCNVVNGHYIVSMSGRNHDMDLDMPKTVENKVPSGDNVFRMRVETEFGGFVVYVSMDGFVLDHKEYPG